MDILHWLQWFENLFIWSLITGIYDQNNKSNEIKIFELNLKNNDIYIAFYSLGIITWFFHSGYYLILRTEDFINRKKQPLSITKGILGLAESNQWGSLKKFLPRVKKLSINRVSNNDGKSALHYAIEKFFQNY